MSSNKFYNFGSLQIYFRPPHCEPVLRALPNLCDLKTRSIFQIPTFFFLRCHFNSTSPNYFYFPFQEKLQTSSARFAQDFNQESSAFKTNRLITSNLQILVRPNGKHKKVKARTILLKNGSGSKKISELHSRSLQALTGAGDESLFFTTIELTTQA